MTRTQTNKALPQSRCSRDFSERTDSTTMSTVTLTLFYAIICCALTENIANVSSPNIIIMLMDDVSCFLCFVRVLVTLVHHTKQQSCLNTESVWQLKTQLLFSGPSVTMSARVFFLCWYELSIVLLFRWAGGTWGCLASPLKRPPTWMPWLLRGCCFLTSTPQTHSAPHVSQQNALEYRTIHFIFTAFFLYLCCHRHNNEMLE